MLSNLHSFHFGALLQNSSALPWHVYHTTTNKLLLSPLKSPATKAATQSTTAGRTPDITLPSLPLKKRTTHFSDKPINSDKPVKKLPAAKPAKAGQAGSQPSAKVAARWKPGRGVIEKVDKTTGEIMHLAAG